MEENSTSPETTGVGTHLGLLPLKARPPARRLSQRGSQTLAERTYPPDNTASEAHGGTGTTGSSQNFPNPLSSIHEVKRWKMGEVDLREKDWISKGDKLPQEQWDTQMIPALEEERWLP